MQTWKSASRRGTWAALLLTLAVTGPMAAHLVGASGGSDASEGSDARAATGGRCDRFEYREGLGLSCGPFNGLWYVALGDGAVLAHADPPPESDGIGPLPAVTLRPPVCVGKSDVFYGHVIYARPPSLPPTRANAMIPAIRATLVASNTFLNSEAQEFNAEADYRMLCDANGEVEVTHVELRPRGSYDFGSVVADVAAAGHTKWGVDYWIWCDCFVWGIGGIAIVYLDDRPGWNWNAYSTGYAVTFGYVSPHIMMHENGHNQGAVQLSAPHAGYGLHCYDGADIMCYSGRTCWRCHYDCNHDDYFHPNPPHGSYLATHWNIAAPYNPYMRVVDHNRPSASGFACAPSAPTPGIAVSCAWRGHAAAPGVAYTVDWGDGTPPMRLPATGFVSPDAQMVAEHAWKKPGTYTVRIRAVDNAVYPRTGAQQSFVQDVVFDHSASASALVGNLGPRGNADEPVWSTTLPGWSARTTRGAASSEDTQSFEATLDLTEEPWSEAAALLGARPGGSALRGTASGASTPGAGSATARVEIVGLDLFGGRLRLEGVEVAAEASAAAGEAAVAVTTRMRGTLWVDGEPIPLADVRPNTLLEVTGLGTLGIHEVHPWAEGAGPRGGVQVAGVRLRSDAGLPGQDVLDERVEPRPARLDLAIGVVSVAVSGSAPLPGAPGVESA